MIVNDEHWLAVADLFGAAALDGDGSTEAELRLNRMR